MRMITLTQGRVTLVDDEDFERLSKHRWYYSTGYARRCIREDGKKKTIRMHREIMNPAKGLDIDHVDHDGLNNCKFNMREVTRAQNTRNKQCRGTGTSSYKGVYFLKRTQKFVAQIELNYKNMHLGYFADERLAAQAYNDAAVKYHGPYACLNVL